MPKQNLNLISSATKRNWNRLGVENPSARLTSRANKRMSEKNIIPTEYISSPDTAEWMCRLLETVRQNGWDIPSVMHSLCLNMLRPLHDLPPVKTAFSDLPKYNLIEPLYSLPLPENEHDLLALAYQSLLSEGARNRKGIYYTPPAVVQDMTRDLQTFSGRCIDPCCGSGAFLTALLKEGIAPENIFGCDIDPIAVMLARTNLLITCRGGSIPKVVCADFLRDELPFPETFDLVITNPPWGALSEPMKLDDFSSSESFSCFLYAACQKLSKNGSVRFLLPQSVLNVRAHRGIRRFLLTQRRIREIRFYDQTFSGVITRFLSMEICRNAENDHICFSGAGISSCIPASFFLRDADCTLRPLEKIDTEIIEKMYARGAHTLKGSTWALGIVTGDNKSKLSDSPAEGLEPILTGKEVQPYVPAPPKKYIRYDRSAFQQAAREEYYRTKEKLIYRFIADRPIFALDTGGTLCLNSANILVPRVSGLSAHTVLALLNCAPIQYLYIKQCGGVKVLKGHLEKLPLPVLSKEQDAFVTEQVKKLLGGAARRDVIQQKLDDYFFALYGLCSEECRHILNIVRKTA